MKKIAFTICAKNYIGLAQVLENSIKAYNKDIDFYIFVADEFSGSDKVEDLPPNVYISKNLLNISKEQWVQMSFKYDITEFCTSIKPSCFKYIFEYFKPSSCIYFDPDILVFNSIDSIYKNLEKYSFILTPHITSIEEQYTGKLNEQSLFYSGIFNLGFLALRNDENAKIMLNWWETRLKDRCFQNRMENLFTDQKWMDFLPSFFPTQVLISSDLGLNIAPWNFYEREIVIKENLYFVKSRIRKDDQSYFSLKFAHFSGFNYHLLCKGEISGGNIKELEIHEDLIVLFNDYEKHLKESNISKFIGYTYTYNYFSNGIYISSAFRKLFRRLLADNRISSNPFDANEQFYLSLQKGKLIKTKTRQKDNISIYGLAKSDAKILFFNRIMYILFRLVGEERFFLLLRLLRMYSKIENHPYLIDKSYWKKFKIWT